MHRPPVELLLSAELPSPLCWRWVAISLLICRPTSGTAASGRWAHFGLDTGSVLSDTSSFLVQHNDASCTSLNREVFPAVRCVPVSPTGIRDRQRSDVHFIMRQTCYCYTPCVWDRSRLEVCTCSLLDLNTLASTTKWRNFCSVNHVTALKMCMLG